MALRIPHLEDFRGDDVQLVSKDFGAARSMIEKAEKRMRFINSQNIDEDDATIIFEEAYTVMLECALCLMMADGYKAKGLEHHKIAVAFIADKYHEFGDKLVMTFERYRKMRADSVYRDNYVGVVEAKDALPTADEYVRITRLIFDSKNPRH